MARVLVTGSGGVIGKVMKAGLPHELTDFDLPHHDVTDFAGLVHAMKGHDIVVHLAWAGKHDNWLTEKFDTVNTESAHNVYEAAHLAGVKRVIMASSVHADDFVNHKKQGLLHPYSLPIPDSPYGASKCFMEALGRYYSDAKGLEVICIRFGGINKDDVAPTSPDSERQVWFSHRDAVALVQACIEAPEVPHKYAIVYGMSNNKGLLHDLTNPFGWAPVDGA